MSVKGLFVPLKRQCFKKGHPFFFHFLLTLIYYFLWSVSGWYIVFHAVFISFSNTYVTYTTRMSFERTEIINLHSSLRPCIWPYIYLLLLNQQLCFYLMVCLDLYCIQQKRSSINIYNAGFFLTIRIFAIIKI